MTALPVVAGWFDHVTPLSLHEPLSRRTWSVRWLDDAEDAYIRSVAVSRTHPAGVDGKLNRRRPRRFAPLFDMTLRIESEPLLLDWLLWSIHESATALIVWAEPPLTVPPAWLVHG